MPRMGTSGIAWCACQTQRTATGRIAGPDSPPVMPARAGAIVSVSTTSPSSVLIIDRPSAPAATTASATATMSVTSGESFAKIGTPRGALSRTAPTTRAAVRGSQAKTVPRSATLGQEMFTSIIATPGRPRSLSASAA